MKKLVLSTFDHSLTSLTTFDFSVRPLFERQIVPCASLLGVFGLCRSALDRCLTFAKPCCKVDRCLDQQVVKYERNGAKSEGQWQNDRIDCRNVRTWHSKTALF